MLIGKFCAHRGVSALIPENTLPAFAAAIALGCDEIELDVRLTKDGELIISHDADLGWIGGTGSIADYTLAELRELNVGSRHGWNVPFCTAEEVFAMFANRTVFNLHLKEHGTEGDLITDLVRIAGKYHTSDSVYFAASPNVLPWMLKKAPDIPRCAIQLPGDAIEIYDMAKEYGCARVQFWLGMFDEPLIRKLHENGILCNLFYADDFQNYEKYFNMGIDVLLTNRMDLASVYRRTKGTGK